jgi:hypothetical protein
MIFHPMRTASILLLLVLVLGLVSEAGAYGGRRVETDYTFSMGEHQFGFWGGREYSCIPDSDPPPRWSEVMLGPLGTHEVPFTATQGLIGFCCILATLIILPVVLTVRWKKKRAN